MTATIKPRAYGPHRPAMLALAALGLSWVTPAGAAPPRREPPGERAAAPDPKGPEYQEALKLFRAGIADFDGGYYNRAIEKFKAAQKLYPSPKIHTRIALAYKWLDKNLKALEHYELFLKEFPEKPDNEADQQLRRQVETTEIPRLLKQVAQVKIVMETPPGAEIRINGRPVATSPVNRLFRLEPGAIAVSAALKGYYEFKRDLDLGRGKSAEVAITMLKIKPKVIQKVITIRATPIYKRWWFWTVVGTVVAGGTAGLGAYLSLRELPRMPTGDRITHDGLTLRW